MTCFSRITTALVLGTAVLTAAADEGHDHGAPAEAPAAHTSPRFVAHSDSFELVGVLDGRQLTLYLDHAADNRPATGAQLALELGGQAVAVKPAADGVFDATLPTAPAEGVIAVAASVQAGTTADLLAGELVISGDGHDEDHGDNAPWMPYAAATAAAVIAVVAAAALRARHRARRAEGARA